MIDQTSQFFAILTNVGTAKQANADALGVPWKLTEMGVGDANGTDPVPSAAQTSLINEWRRRPLNQLFIDPVNPAVIVAEQVIPADEGGYWIREIGLYDADGDLVAVANCPPSFKPIMSQGSGRTQVVRMNFIVSSTGNITLKIDPSVVLATREFVERRILEELYKLDNKQSVRAATTANIALTGLQTIDGISLVAGDRVLVKNQTASKDNGIYIVGVAAWQRAPDADSNAEVTSAMILSVEQGTTLADTRWQLVTDGAIVLGTTALTFQNITQGFAPLNAPALINPTANTPPQFDSSTRVQTTAFAKRMGVEYSGFSPLVASTSLSASSVGGIVSAASSVPINITLPPTAGVSEGATVEVVNSGAGAVTILAAGADVLASQVAGAITVILGTGDNAEFVKVSATWRLRSGSIALKYSAVMSGQNWNTQTLFDSSKALATTEFVKKNSGNHAAIGGLGANTTLTSANTFGMAYMLNSATPFTVTLPLASTSPNGGVVTFTNVLTAPVTIALQGTDYMTGIDGVGAGGSVVLRQRDTITLTCAGSNVWYAEDGSVRDAQSTAIRSLMGNFSGTRILTTATTLTSADTGVLCIGSGALAGVDITLPQLSTTVSGQSIVISAGGAAFNLKAFGGDPGISIGVSVLSTLPIDIFESVILISNTTGWRVISGTVLNKYSGMFAASLSTNGYEKLPSGLIRQWCNGSIPAGAGTVHITLPITFPNNLIAYSFGTSASAHWVTGQSASPSGIDVLVRTISAGTVVVPSGVVGYTFECVGY